jgi:hypothetical protein
MSARDVIEHALRVYYADSRDPNGLVDKVLAEYDTDLAARIRGEVLAEAAAEADRAADIHTDRGDADRAAAAFALAVRYRRLATDAREKSSRTAADATRRPVQAGGTT